MRPADHLQGQTQTDRQTDRATPGQKPWDTQLVWSGGEVGADLGVAKHRQQDAVLIRALHHWPVAIHRQKLAVRDLQDMPHRTK
jgi:hypothetical protein